MRSIAIVACAVLISGILLGCRERAQDPIDRLMAAVPYEEVPSYLYSPIMLPSTATATQLVGSLSGQFTQMDIVDVRATQTRPRPGDEIPVEKFTAVLLQTEKGRKILLLRPDPKGWYYKFYDAR
jgi:hypothetical protein